MPTPTKGPRLGGGPAHERLMLANLATSLLEHDRITTTEAKAKRLRPLAERMITFAKRGDLPARRRVLTVVRDKGVVHRLFTEIAPDMAERRGGYTRITKIGARKGDNAPMAVIELVREPLSAKQATVKEAEAAARRAAKPATAPEETRQIAADADAGPVVAEAEPEPGDLIPDDAGTSEALEAIEERTAEATEADLADADDGDADDGDADDGDADAADAHAADADADDADADDAGDPAPEDRR